MDLYSSNLEFFKVNLYPIYEIIVQETSIYSSTFESVREKNNLLVTNNEKQCFVHSLYDIQREIVNMFSEVDKDIENLVVFGMGLGYSIDYICDNFPKLNRIVIIEPDLNIFRQSLYYVNFEDMLIKFNNITFIVNQTPTECVNILWNSISNRVKEKLDLVYNISYRTLYTGYFEEISLELKKYIKNTLLNIATEEFFLYSWPVNIFKNLKQQAIPIECFFNKFENVPAVIVSAGPSLNKNIKYLSDIKNKAVIIAVGSAIKILHNNGIIPHYRFAFDAGEHEKKIFNGINTEDSVLVFSDLLYHEVLPEYDGKKIRMVLDTDFISQYIQRNIGNKYEEVASGFSIANVAMDAVCKMGFKKVILVGQDLCYTEGNLYAKGFTDDEKNVIDLKKEKYIKMKDIYNQDVYTISMFMGMKDLLEDIIEKNSEIEFVNATEGGLPIKGAKNKTFRDVMKEDMIKNIDVYGIIQDVYDKFDYKGNDAKVIRAILEVDKQLEELININNEMSNQLIRVNKYFSKNIGVNRLVSELRYIDSFEERFSKYSFYNEAVKPMIASKFRTINVSYSYNGNEKIRQVESKLKTLLGQSSELKMYLDLLKSLIEEFKKYKNVFNSIN